MTQETKDELQTDNDLSETTDEVVSESATETSQEDNDDVEAKKQGGDPAGYTKRINKKHRELMEEKRARVEAEQKIQDLQSQLPKEVRPEIPALPDPYDDDYDQRMKQRDEAIIKATAFDAKQAQQVQTQQAQQQQQHQQQQQNFIKTVQSYSERAAKLNVSEQELQAAGQTVNAYGIHDEVARHILSDEQGPLITSFLARNPVHLEAMQQLSPMQAAVYIATNVKPNVVNKSAGNSDLPAPADTLSGGGVTETKRGPKGATFE